MSTLVTSLKTAEATDCEEATGVLKLACDLNPINVAQEGVEAGKTAAEGIQEVAEFSSNPLGYLAEKAQASSHSLATDLLPQINGALHPDLSARWFLAAYAISFALAIFAWLVHLLWNFVQYSQSRISSTEMADVLTTRMALFFGGAIFGPAIGVLLTKFFAAMTDPIAAWAVGGAMEGTPKASEGTAHALAELIASGKTDEIIGGELVALLIFICMAIGLLMTVLTLAVVVVTFYLTGVIFPLGWSWVTSARHHHRAMQLVSVWLGLLMTPPLLFLMLGAALRLANGTLLSGLMPGLEEKSPEGVRLLVGLAVAVIALWIVGTAPFTLLKFAPVLPSGSTPSGLGRRSPRQGGGGFAGGGGGTSSGGSSGMSQAASDGYLDTGSGGAASGASGGGGDALTAVADSMAGRGSEGSSGSGGQKKEAAMAAATLAGPEAALAAEAASKSKSAGDKPMEMASGAAGQATAAAQGAEASSGDSTASPAGSSGGSVGSGGSGGSGGGAAIAATVASGSSGGSSGTSGAASSSGGGSSIVDGLKGAAAEMDQMIAPLADTAAQQVEDHRHTPPPPRPANPHHDGRGDH